MGLTAAGHADGREPSDALVARVLAGDTDAFGALIRRHQREVWGVASALLERAAAENLVQQCFVSAYEHLDQYEPGRDFSVWLKAIARNLVLKELRTASREMRRLGQYREHLIALLGAPDASESRAEVDAQSAARWDRMHEALRRCREGLAPAATQALALRYEQGLGLPDVAGALGRTVVATRQLLFRTRLVLKACLEKAHAT